MGSWEGEIEREGMGIMWRIAFVSSHRSIYRATRQEFESKAGISWRLRENGQLPVIAILVLNFGPPASHYMDQNFRISRNFVEFSQSLFNSVKIC